MSNNDRRKPAGDYETGYCRPPRAGQWEKGQSGNRKGRPKRGTGGDYFDEMLQRKHPITQNGRRRVLTRREAFYEKVYFDAMNGDASARRIVAKEIEQRDAKAEASLPRVIEAKLVLEEEPPFPVREAIDELTGVVETYGSDTPQELRDALGKLVSHYQVYYPNWRPRSLN